jgi:N-acetylglutamate synthase-like GNAT family acetyltransferase
MPEILRTATQADAAAIRDLTRAAYAKWVPLIGREPKPMAADYAAALRDHRIDLLEIDGDLAALIELIPAADHLLIENIAVAPARQGSGLGAGLLAHAEAIARAQGVAELRLYTNQRFVENIAFYRRRGFAVTREEALPHGVATHMAKRLG